MSIAKIGQRLAPRSLRGVLIAALAALAFSVLPIAAAHASYYLDASAANRLAADYVARHYANTYAADLITECRPQYRHSVTPGYVYHRWACEWWDTSDRTSGRVLIVGSRGTDRYYGAVINGARR